jgi:hypothetical protein
VEICHEGGGQILVVQKILPQTFRRPHAEFSERGADGGKRHGEEGERQRAVTAMSQDQGLKIERRTLNVQS